jgi:hypothetical protein
MTLSNTSVPPSPPRQFVDWIDAVYEDAGDETKSFSAFELSGWTVVLARNGAGEQLRELVETEWLGTVQMPREEEVEP